MGPKHFENKARREWWSLHVDGWQRSGLSQRSYCAIHRLTETTFVRWRRVLTDAQAAQTQAELLREERRERRRKGRVRLSTDMRSKAVQAYWAMHVEAMTWCGMSAQAYAKAHRLSVHSLKRWRILVEADGVQIDWRAHVHPSALPQLSTRTKPSAKEHEAELNLTTSPDCKPTRRNFSEEEKRAIVLETERRGTTVSSVARKHGVAASLVFRWRVQFGLGKQAPAKLAEVRVAGAQSELVVLNDLLQPPDGMTAVELGDGRCVFAPVGSDPDAVRRHVAERETS